MQKQIFDTRNCFTMTYRCLKIHLCNLREKITAFLFELYKFYINTMLETRNIYESADRLS